MSIFRKASIWNYICQFCALFLIAYSVLIARKNNWVITGELFKVILSSTICFVFSTILRFFNYKAYLSIQDGQIKAKYHWFGKIDCKLSDVDFALAQINTLIIQLKDGKCHTIMGILNSLELASMIRRNMSFEATKHPKALIEKLNGLKSAKKKGIIYVCSGVALMFANIFITAFLTGAREPDEFSKTDWTVMTVMGIVEVITVIVTFYFAQKTGKNNVPIEKLHYVIQRTLIETEPLLPGKVIKVFADENYTGRLAVYGYPNEDFVYYTVQVFTSEYALVTDYTSEIFENIEQLHDAFDELIDITEKVLRNQTSAKEKNDENQDRKTN